MQQTKDKLLAERDRLKQEEDYVQSPFYLEEVARNELHMSKKGETVVIIPGDLVVGGEEMNKTDEKVEERENWQKWWEVLSGKE